MKGLKIRIWDEISRCFIKLGTVHDAFESTKDGMLLYHNYQNGAAGSEINIELFSGSKDKKEEEIFDNDILMLTETQVGANIKRDVYYRVFFCEDCLCWACTRSFSDNDGYSWSETPLRTILSLGAIKIGNIHQTAIATR